MLESNDREFEQMLDFFILSGFTDGPQSISAIHQRIKWAERLLYLASARKGKRGFGSLPEALEKLQNEGFLKIECLGKQSGAEIIYALTDVGKQRLEQERVRRKMIVSQFVEDSELDGSFQRFLGRKGPVWPS